LKSDADYPMETYIKKNPASGKLVSYARTILKLRFRRKKIGLTIKHKEIARSDKDVIMAY